jgi:hypothetical protein
VWEAQGGSATIKSYKKGIPETHKDFFLLAVPYHIEKNNLFVHGGFDVYHGKKVQETPVEFLTWDRSIINCASNEKIPGFSTVFIGHTTTQIFGETQPVKLNNLWMMDCGAGWDGRLCLMNIKTGQYWLSKKQSPNQ